MDRSAWRVATAVVAALVLSSCRSFAPPSPELLAVLPPAHDTQFLQRQIEFTIDSPDLSGVFEGILVARAGSDAAVRLQLFPDVGGQVLDLAIDSDAIEALRADFEEPFHAALPPDERMEASLPLFFAVTLVEHFTPLAPQRIIGARKWEDGWEIKLQPHSSGVRVRAYVDGEGNVVRRRFKYGFLKWYQTSVDPLRVESWGVEVELDTVDEEIVDELPTDVFRLLFEENMSNDDTTEEPSPRDAAAHVPSSGAPPEGESA